METSVEATLVVPFGDQQLNCTTYTPEKKAGSSDFAERQRICNSVPCATEVAERRCPFPFWSNAVDCKKARRRAWEQPGILWDDGQENGQLTPIAFSSRLRTGPFRRLVQKGSKRKKHTKPQLEINFVKAKFTVTLRILKEKLFKLQFISYKMTEESIFDLRLTCLYKACLKKGDEKSGWLQEEVA